MILRQATIKQFGYDPNKLSKFSHKKICISCNMCGKIGEIEFKNYKKLCKKCCQIGHKVTKQTKEKIAKGNSGKTRSDETKIIQSCIRQKIDREDWSGFISQDRSHKKYEYQCQKLNTKFIGSEFHHITKSIGVYIPLELHQHIRHNLKNGKNMGEINVLAIQFINGGLNE